MANALRNFEKRASAIESRHRKLADGYVTKMDKDGVMRHAPIRRLRLFRPRMIVYALACFLGFKAFLLIQLGSEVYNERVVLLANGTTVERAGAYVMAVDPATQWIAQRLQSLSPQPVAVLEPAAPVESAPVVSQ